MKPHIHAEFIKAWADGAEIEYKTGAGHWVDCTNTCAWVPDVQYRIKPAAPKWPETTLTRDDVFSIWGSASGDGANACMVLANETLSHACETGQLVNRSEYDRDIEMRDHHIENLRAQSSRKSDYISELRADRADRDKAIAEAVAHAYQHAKYTIAGPDAVDLAAIIAEVRP